MRSNNKCKRACLTEKYAEIDNLQSINVADAHTKIKEIARQKMTYKI